MMIQMLVLGLLVCLLLIALLSASEAALAATNRVRLRHLLQTGNSPEDHNAAQLLSNELSGDVQRFIATVTVAANMPLLLAAALTMYIAREHLGTAAAVVTAGLAFAIVPLFQITPRLLVSRRGTLEKLWWVRPARLLVALIGPPVRLLLFFGVMILRPLGLFPPPKPVVQGDESKLGSAEEIRDLVETAQASGIIEEGGKELIESIFDFGDTRVHEVMIPRPDILTLPVTASVEEVLNALQESGFSRLPLHEGTVDRIEGILHAKDMLRALSRGEVDFSVQSLMRAPVYVPESRKIDEALSLMRAERTHLAIVIDEYGGTAGLLTVEDVLEELVGEIADEHDRREEEPLQIIDENAAIVDALLHTDDLRDQWDVVLPTGEFDTVGGFMIEQLGRALACNDRVELPNATLVVLSLRAGRPKKIRIDRKPVEDETVESNE